MSRTEPRRFAIDDLFPFEASALQSTVDYYRELLKDVDPDKLRSELENKDGHLPKVLEIDGEWMVVEGNSRVFAALQAGHTHIYADIAYRSNLDSYRRTLEIRKEKSQRGFAAFPIDISKTDRAARNQSEF